MKTHIAKLGDITADDITRVIKNMKCSAPGLDQITVAELKIIALWSPELIAALAKLLPLIDQKQDWPWTLTRGVVSLIPKDPSNTHLKPDEFRPITILSSVYRVWAACLYLQLATCWLPQWQHHESCAKAADQLAYDTCMDLQKKTKMVNLLQGFHLTCKSVLLQYPSNSLIRHVPNARS